MYSYNFLPRLLAIVIFVFLGQQVFAADYFWVGGSGDWSDHNNHWATSSGGSSFHNQVPSQLDNVYFDANSFTAAGQVVNMNVPGFCKDMIWEGTQYNPQLQSTSLGLEVAGKFEVHDTVVIALNGSGTFLDISGDFLVDSTQFSLTVGGGFFYMANFTVVQSSFTLNHTGGLMRVSGNFEIDNSTLDFNRTTTYQNLEITGYFRSDSSTVDMENYGGMSVGGDFTLLRDDFDINQRYGTISVGGLFKSDSSNIIFGNEGMSVTGAVTFDHDTVDWNQNGGSFTIGAGFRSDSSNLDMAFRSMSVTGDFILLRNDFVMTHYSGTFSITGDFRSDSSDLTLNTYGVEIDGDLLLDHDTLTWNQTSSSFLIRNNFTPVYSQLNMNCRSMTVSGNFTLLHNNLNFTHASNSTFSVGGDFLSDTSNLDITTDYVDISGDLRFNADTVDWGTSYYYSYFYIRDQFSSQNSILNLNWRQPRAYKSFKLNNDSLVFNHNYGTFTIDDTLYAVNSYMDMNTYGVTINDDLILEHDSVVWDQTSGSFLILGDMISDSTGLNFNSCRSMDVRGDMRIDKRFFKLNHATGTFYCRGDFLLNDLETDLYWGYGYYSYFNGKWQTDSVTGTVLNRNRFQVTDSMLINHCDYDFTSNYSTNYIGKSLIFNESPIDWTHTPQLQIGESMVLDSNMVWGQTGSLYFNSSTNGNIVAAAGHPFDHDVQFYGGSNSSEWTIQDNFDVDLAHNVTVQRGSVLFGDCNPVLGNYFNADYSNLINLDFTGSDTVTVGYYFRLYTSTNTTIELDSARLMFVNPGTNIPRLDGGGKKFYDVEVNMDDVSSNRYMSLNDNGTTIDSLIIFAAREHYLDINSSFQIGDVLFDTDTAYGTASPRHYLDGNSTIGTYTIIAPNDSIGAILDVNTSNSIDSLKLPKGSLIDIYSSNTLTINDYLEMPGTGCIRPYIQGGRISSNGDSIVVDFVVLENNTALGTALFKAPNGSDLGNVVGWQVDSADNRMYWIGDGGNFSDPMHWSYTSGGSPADCAPQDFNELIFDVNSFSQTGQTVTYDVPSSTYQSMTWDNVGFFPVFDGTTSGADLYLDRDFSINAPMQVINLDYTTVGGDFTVSDSVDFDTRTNFRVVGDVSLTDKVDMRISGSMDIDGDFSMDKNTVFHSNSSTIADGNFTLQNEADFNSNSSVTVGGHFLQQDSADFSSSSSVSVSGNFLQQDSTDFSSSSSVSVGGNYNLQNGAAFYGGNTMTVQGNFEVEDSASYRNSRELNVYKSFTLGDSISNFELVSNKIVYFLATTSGNTIDLGGHVLDAQAYFDGENGRWTLLDDFRIEENRRTDIRRGHLVSNGFTCDFGSIMYMHHDARYYRGYPYYTYYYYNVSLNLAGSDSAIVHGNWQVSTRSETSLTMGTAVLFIKDVSSVNIDGGDNQYHKLVVLTDTSASNTVTLTDNNSFNDSTIFFVNNTANVNLYGGNWKDVLIEHTDRSSVSGDKLTVDFGQSYTHNMDDVKIRSNSMTPSYVHFNRQASTDILSLPDGTEVKLENYTLYVNDSLLLQGDCVNYGKIIGNGQTSSTINMGSTDSSKVVVDFVELENHQIIGNAVSYPATNAVDIGGTAGWGFANAAAVDYYWVGGTGDWSDPTHWATSSGGTPDPCVPTANDNVIFDANSFSATAQTVTVDYAASARDMTWDGAIAGAIFQFNQELDLRGHAIIRDSIVVKGSYNVNVDSSFTATGNLRWNKSGSLTVGKNFEVDGESYWANINPLNVGDSMLVSGDNTWSSVRSITVGESFVVNDSSVWNSIYSNIVVGEDFIVNGPSRWDRFYNITVGNDLKSSDNSYWYSNSSSYTIQTGNDFEVSGESDWYYVQLDINGKMTVNGASDWQNLGNITVDDTFRVTGSSTWDNNSSQTITTGAAFIVEGASSWNYFDHDIAGDMLVRGASNWNMAAGGDFRGDFIVTDSSTWSSSGSMNFFQSFSLDSSINWNYSGTMYFMDDDGGRTIQTSGNRLNSTVYFRGEDDAGEWTLQDNLEVGGDIRIERGTLVSGGNRLEARSLYMPSTYTRDIIGTYTCYQYGYDYSCYCYRYHYRTCTQYSAYYYYQSGLDLTGTDSVFIEQNWDIQQTYQNADIEMGIAVLKFESSLYNQFSFFSNNRTRYNDIIAHSDYTSTGSGLTLDANTGDTIPYVDVYMRGSREIRLYNDAAVFGDVQIRYGSTSSIPYVNLYGSTDYGDVVVTVSSPGNVRPQLQLNDGNMDFGYVSLPLGSRLYLEEYNTSYSMDSLSISSNCQIPATIEGRSGYNPTLTINGGQLSLDYPILRYHTLVDPLGGYVANSADNTNASGWTQIARQPQTFYWVGGTGNWNDTTHWSFTSGGPSTGCYIPSEIDDVIFDGNSFTGSSQYVYTNYDVTINNMTWRNLDPNFTNIRYNSDSYSLTTNGNLRIENSDFTWYQRYDFLTVKGDFLVDNADGIMYRERQNLTVEGDMRISNSDFDISYTNSYSQTFRVKGNMVWQNSSGSIYSNYSTVYVEGDLRFVNSTTDWETRQNIYVGGSLQLDKDMADFYVANLYFNGPVLGNTIDLDGQNMYRPVYISGTGGWRIIADFNTSTTLNFVQGTFESNGYDIRAQGISSSGSGLKTLDFTGTDSVIVSHDFRLTGTNQNYDLSNTTVFFQTSGNNNFRINAGGGTIEDIVFDHQGTNTNTITFESSSAGPNTYGDISIEVVGRKDIVIQGSDTFGSITTLYDYSIITSPPLFSVYGNNFFESFVVEGLGLQGPHLTFYDDNSFDGLIVTGRGTQAIFGAGKTQTINNGLLIIGVGGFPVIMKSTNPGQQATIHKDQGEICLDFVRLSDMLASGSATFNAGASSQDITNNTNWIFGTSCLAHYWVEGTGNWNDISHWAISSGGTVKHLAPPKFTDNVVFDANSFSALGDTVYLNVNNAVCNNMSWLSSLYTPTFFNDQGYDMSVHGGLTLVRNMNLSLDGAFRFKAASDTSFINSGGQRMGNMYFEGPAPNSTTGSWILGKDLESDSTIYLEQGRLMTGDRNISTPEFVVRTTQNKALELGSSDVTIESGIWDMQTTTNLSFDAGTSTIILNDDGGTATFNGGGATYHDLELRTLSSSTQSINDANTFNTIIVNNGITAEFEYSKTQTLDSLYADGGCEDDQTIKSSLDGTQATLHKASGTNTIRFTDIKDIAITGSSTFSALQSTDLGNNSGWTIDPFANVALSISATETSPPSHNDGTATVTATGNGPFTYLWSNNQRTSTISNLTPGTYTVYVTDADFCVDSISVTVI